MHEPIIKIWISYMVHGCCRFVSVDLQWLEFNQWSMYMLIVMKPCDGILILTMSRNLVHQRQNPTSILPFGSWNVGVNKMPCKMGWDLLYGNFLLFKCSLLFWNLNVLCCGVTVSMFMLTSKNFFTRGEYWTVNTLLHPSCNLYNLCWQL